MKSTDNRDIFRDDPKRMAEAWWASAETALINPFFSWEERQERHQHYVAEAMKWEARI